MILSNFTTIDGVRLEYAKSNDDASKPWIVLVFPFGMRLPLAKPFFDVFESTHNVLVWESRLFFSEPPEQFQSDKVSTDHYVDDLIALMSVNQIERAHLFGYCAGAGIALKAAASFPSLFLSLSLIHGDFILLNEPGCTTQSAKDLDALLPLAANDLNTAKFILDKLSANGNSNEHTPDGVLLPYSCYNLFYRLAHCYLSYKTQDYLSLSQKVHHKCRIYCGRKDTLTNLESAKKVHDAMHDSTLHIDNNADHYGILRTNSPTLASLKEDLVEFESIVEEVI